MLENIDDLADKQPQSESNIVKATSALILGMLFVGLFNLAYEAI